MNWGHKTDGDLLAAFASAAAEEAFAELVRRHGAMVFRTCRRIAGNRCDAEDATQAVFATLAAKAASLTGCRSVAGWLYNTAWHVAMRFRRAEHVRRRYERQAVPADATAAAE